MLDWYFSLKWWKLYSGIVLVNLLLIGLSQFTLINEIVFFNTFSDQITHERSMVLFGRMKSLFWTAYLLTPLLLLVKFCLVSLIIYIGVFFNEMQKVITLGKIFIAVIAAEGVFLIASAAKLLWFIFFAGNYTLADLRFFYPLSLINMFRQEDVAAYWIYPLQTINLFQIAYMFLLAVGLSKISAVSRDHTDRIVLITYIPAITIWIALVMFLSIDTAA